MGLTEYLQNLAKSISGAGDKVTDPVNGFTKTIGSIFGAIAGGISGISDALTIKTDVKFDYRNLITPAIIVGGLFLLSTLLKKKKK